ncbi:hypothetical protein [Arthrobacter cryoconiti]|uniref:Uncharacterized protein n=1 Tax=Arthrobacter cryoconiti TaxID=748907 RepID=A0ABV8R125_9MICC|nr:hypothetical protein [Arthrobacter cryoconiti]MCC9069841.1 hypothetical protein [Arthrobacter cryoconiti]
MSWWSWILLWIALVALSLLFIAWLALRIWRAASTTMRAASEVGEELGAYWDGQVKLAQDEHVTSERFVTPGSAVFATPEQMKDDYLAAKEDRQFVRLQRRVARRKERGQLQSLRDITALEDVG